MIDSPNQAKPRFIIALLLLAFAAVMGALPVWACDVPVFRFALERWPADPYQATIFHKGPLDDKQQGIVDWLDESLAKAHFPLMLRSRWWM